MSVDAAVAPDMRRLPEGGGKAIVDAGVDCSPVAAGGPNPNTFPDTPCDDRVPERVADFVDAPLGVYSIDCDPQPLDAPGCKGIPSDTWSRCAHQQCAAEHSYPEGCNVALPTQNPNYPGSPQGCGCRRFNDDSPLEWECPL